MNLFFAVVLGLIFIYLIARYFLQFYANYSKKMNLYVKKKGYRSYSSYKKLESKNEKKKTIEQKKKLERRRNARKNTK